MKTYYVEERALVIVQHLVNAKNKKEAIQLAKDGEAQKSEIIEYLDTDGMDITEVGVYDKKETLTEDNQLRQLVKGYEKDYAKYVMGRSEITSAYEIKNRREALAHLYDYDLDTQGESTARESGHLAGLQEAIRVLYSNK